jgi:hypothetical protein
MVELTSGNSKFNKCNEAILISGGARSGTTILGKIMHTFQDVEYSFEPPMLFSLFPLLPVLPEHHWKLLYESYLYEEFLMNALAGRGLNCNRADDSSIYNVKKGKLIESRLRQSLRKADAEELAKKSQIAYKMPDVVPFLPQLKRYYSGTWIVIMTRKAPEVFNSILEKAWFSTKALKEKNLIWPNRIVNGLKVPFWVDGKDYQDWCEMDELQRTAYYYLRVNESLKNIPGCIRIRYDDLIEDPKAITKLLTERLNLAWGDKTDHILSTVSRTRKYRNYKILNKLEPEIREQVEYYSSMS